MTVEINIGIVMTIVMDGRKEMIESQCNEDEISY